MKKRTRTWLFLVVLVLLCLVSGDVLPVQGQPSVSLMVNRVVWGDDPDSPIKAYPGDEDVALTVEMQNYSNETIKGVNATLALSGPFVDIYGNQDAKAAGEPSDVGNIMNQTGEILPAGFFTLTFNLDLGSNALPRAYRYNMTLDYLVKSGEYWLKGETKTVVVSFIVSKIQAAVACSVSPGSVEKGESVDVSGSIDPAQENLTVTLTYKNPVGSSLSRTVKTDSEGSYRESYQPDIEGSWSVNASWSGDDRHKGDWLAVSFEVRFPVSLSITTSDNRLVGGFDNQFDVILRNSGGVLLSTIDVALSIPSPLIVHGDNQWTFESLEPGNSTLIPVEIFAPASSIGTTYSGTLNVNYRDDYGETHTDSYPIGLILKGRIELVVYDKIVSPQPARPGSKLVITATILNKGNVAAEYVNASVVSNAMLELTTESAAYVGEVEENSPAPVTLTANLDTNVQNGTYPLVLKVTYRDDQYVDHSFNVTFFVRVEKNHDDQSTTDGTEGLLGPLSEIGLVLTAVIAMSIVIVVLYRRRSLHSRRTQNALGKTEQ
jgi:hypothetical protein